MGRDAMVGADGAWTEERGSGVRLTVDAAEVRDLSEARLSRERKAAIEELDWYFGCADTLMGYRAASIAASGLPSFEPSNEDFVELSLREQVAHATEVFRRLGRMSPRDREILRSTFESRAWDVAFRAALHYRQSQLALCWIACRVPSSVRAMVARGKSIDGPTPIPYLVQEFLTWEARSNARALFVPIRDESIAVFHHAVDAYGATR